MDRPQIDRKPPLLRRLRWAPWGKAAVIVVGIIVAAAGLVLPAKMVVHGWHTASSIRGVGDGAGTFTASSCQYESTDSSNNDTYRCYGLFHRPGFHDVLADVSASRNKTGDLRARIEADGTVDLDDPGKAALFLALWTTLALGTAAAAALAVRCAVVVTIGGSDLSRALEDAKDRAVLPVIFVPVSFVPVFLGLVIAFAILDGDHRG